MGLEVPLVRPQLPAGDNFGVTAKIFTGDCGGVHVGFNICVQNGATINAWYAAGNDCKVGTHICGGDPDQSSKITEIEAI